MSWYELWLFLHVAATILWVGGGAAVQVFGLLAKRAADPAQTAAFGRNTAWIATRVFMPSAAVVLATGALLVEDGGWDWSEPFVLVGLAGWAVVAATAFAYLGPRMRMLGARMAAQGPSAALVSAIGRLVILARVIVLVLFFVVFMMVTKVGT